MVKIDDFYKLSALHKAILAAKFATFPDPQYAAITEDPILAGISNEIYDEMCRLQEKQMKGAGKDWQDWRRVKTSRGYNGSWRIAVMAARNDRMFMEQSREDKIKIAKCCLSPFTCTETELNEFVDEVERKNGAQSIETLFKENDLDGAQLYDLSHNYLVTGGEARLVIGSKRIPACDVFFSGVQTFRVSKEGSAGIEDSIPALKKYTVSSGSLQKFDGSFANEKCKLRVVIEAEQVDYWL
ncbi:MAG: hypothetical protein IK990_04515 [Ruminiclostridium sp.]|nr:hypothetical protein [Ruminiclostridium sp.]